jgi:hypothetical protein
MLKGNSAPFLHLVSFSPATIAYRPRTKQHLVNATINPTCSMSYPGSDRLPSRSDHRPRLLSIPLYFLLSLFSSLSFLSFLSGASASPGDPCREPTADRSWISRRNALVFLFPFVRSSRSSPRGEHSGSAYLPAPCPRCAPAACPIGHAQLYSLFYFFFFNPLGRGWMGQGEEWRGFSGGRNIRSGYRERGSIDRCYGFVHLLDRLLRSCLLNPYCCMLDQ